MFHAPETPYGKELWKWDHTIAETNPHDPESHGMRPIHPQDYPMRLYRVTERNPIALAGLTVADAIERRLQESAGYVAGGPLRALEAYDAQQKEFAELAANRAFSDRRMSDAARAEAALADEDADGHLPAVPETPVKRRGPRKRQELTHA